MRIRRRLAAALAALMLPGAALAQGYTLDGLRLYAPDDWRVITRENLEEHRDFLEDLGADTAWEGLVPRGGCVIYAPAGEARLVSGPECAVDSVWQADESARAEILQLSTKTYPALSGGWLNEEWVLLTGDEAGLWRRVYVTCQYGRLWALECDSFGREFTAQEAAGWDETAQKLCVMGQKTEPVIGPVVIPAHAGQAEVRPSQDGVPLTLEPPFATVVAPFEVKGRTAPEVSLRYYVNGVGVERFKSDGEGNFTVVIKHLEKGENAVRIQAIDGGARGSVLFYCQYDPARTPFTLGEVPAQVFEEQVLIRGRALSGTQLTLLREGRAHARASVGEDGLFTLTAACDREKTYTFTLQAEHPDYRRGEARFEVQRVAGPEKMDGVTALKGRITRLGSDPDGPYLWFEGEQGEALCLSMPCLEGFEEATGTLYVRLLDTTRLGAREARLVHFVPDSV